MSSIRITVLGLVAAAAVAAPLTSRGQEPEAAGTPVAPEVEQAVQPPVITTSQYAASYSGRVSFRPPSSAEDLHTTEGVTLTVLGAAHTVIAADGQATSYSLRLAAVAVPGRPEPALELEVLEAGAGGDRRLAATWANIDSPRIGFDLGWLQADFARSPTVEISTGLRRLAEWMTGSFSSASQADRDSDFQDIQLHAARIWPERGEGVWIYAEQAVASKPDQPYRQRINLLTEPEPGLYSIRVFTFPDPLRFSGAWREPARLSALSPADLEDREGCAILLRDLGSEFKGSTLADLCASQLRDASFAISEVTITADTLTSWDRGFDASGSQVWGSRKGGYVLTRLEEDEGAGS